VMWSVMVVVLLGLLVGACFRVPALLVATTATIAGNIIVGLFGGVPYDSVLLSTLGLLLALQGAYLFGLLFGYLWSRLRVRGMSARETRP
jgi:hypothetical protein